MDEKLKVNGKTLDEYLESLYADAGQPKQQDYPQERRKGRRAIILLGFVFTSAHQSTGAPIVDLCNGKTQEGQRWSGYAIHLTPWRKNMFGDRRSGLAFCVGRIGKAS